MDDVTMKAIVKYSAEPGDMRVMDVPVPKPGPGEVLVKIKATGICYSDVSILGEGCTYVAVISWLCHDS